MTKRKGVVKEQTPEVSKPASVIEAPVVEGKKVEEVSTETKVEEPVVQHFCKDCIGYNHELERNFVRKVGPKNDKGERTVITEIRSVCENEKATSHGHLVMAEYVRPASRQCPVWTAGVYQKPERKKKSKVAETQKTEETKDPTPGVPEGIESLPKPRTIRTTAHERRQKQKSVAINGLASSDGEVAQLTKTSGTKVVTVQKVQ